MKVQFLREARGHHVGQVVTVNEDAYVTTNIVGSLLQRGIVKEVDGPDERRTATAGPPQKRKRGRPRKVQ